MKLERGQILIVKKLWWLIIRAGELEVWTSILARVDQLINWESRCGNTPQFTLHSSSLFGLCWVQLETLARRRWARSLWTTRAQTRSSGRSFRRTTARRTHVRASTSSCAASSTRCASRDRCTVFSFPNASTGKLIIVINAHLTCVCTNMSTSVCRSRRVTLSKERCTTASTIAAPDTDISHSATSTEAVGSNVKSLLFVSTGTQHTLWKYKIFCYILVLHMIAK